jgi:hypothetical protein
VAQDWNSTDLPWQDTDLPWKNTGQPWNDTDLPWKGDSGGTAAPVISQITSGSPTPTRTQIAWETDIAADSVVEYGTTVAYGSSVSDLADVTSHALIVSDLTPATTYHYRVKSGSTTSADGEFTTAATSWDAAAIYAADSVNYAWLFGATTYGVEATWLTAAGGVTGSGDYTAGPSLGANLTTNGTFDADASWTKGSGWTIAAGVAHKGTAAAAGVSQAIAIGTRVVQFSYDVVAQNAGNIFAQLTGSLTVNGANRTAIGSYSEYLSGNNITTVSVRGDGTATNADIDNVTVKVALPTSNFGATGWTIIVSGIAASSHASEEVLAILSDGTVNNFGRIVRDTSGNIRAQVTSFGVSVVDIDFGNVPDSDPYAVAYAAAANNSAGSLNGAAVVAGTTDNTLSPLPPVSQFVHKTGLKVQMTASRMSNANLAIAAENAGLSFRIAGDSIAASAGATGSNYWYKNLAQSYAPDRAYDTLGTAVGGYKSQAIRDALLADTTHDGWTVLLWDGGYSEDGTPQDWIDNISAGLVGRSRFLVICPLQRTDGTNPDVTSVIALIAAEWPSNYLDLNSALSDPSTRGDNLHPNDTGYDIAWPLIKAKLDLLGY